MNFVPCCYLDVEKYFYDKEWESMSELEQNRSRNLLGNYSALTTLGFNPSKPDFIVKYEKRLKNQFGQNQIKTAKRTAAPSKSKKFKNNGANKMMDSVNAKTRTRKNKTATQVTATKTPETDSTEVNTCQGSSEDENKCFKVPVPAKRYPRRNVPKVNYAEPDDIELDHYLQVSFDCNTLSTHHHHTTQIPASWRDNHAKLPKGIAQLALSVTTNISCGESIDESGTQSVGRVASISSNGGVEKSHVESTSAQVSRRHTCIMCPKKFTKKCDLIRHIRTHTGEKPYECTVCSKKFAQNSNFKSHMRIHNGEKPYACTVCDKTFAQKPNLNSHMRTHTRD